MKLLYILNLTSRVNSFSMSSILAAKDLGIDFHIAGNWSYSSEADRINDEQRLGIYIYQVDFHRNPLHPGNLKAYYQLSEIAGREKFDAIHCNTPVGGLIGRIIGKRFNVKEVIYQAHGFHFYKGAPFLNWLIYYPVEKWMARLTDDLICINREDYEFAQKRLRLRNTGRIHYIPGVGIDTKRYESIWVDKRAKREALGIPPDAFLILSVGELNGNKNHITVIQAIKLLPQVHYAIAGRGLLQYKLAGMAEMLGVSNRVHFLGFRTDLAEIYSIADVFCLPSKREGLSTAIMEAMASELPIVCSDIRGNRDLVVQHKGGHLVETMDKSGYVTAIRDLIDDPQLRSVMAHFNTEHIKDFCLERVIDMMQVVYREALGVL